MTSTGELEMGRIKLQCFFEIFCFDTLYFRNLTFKIHFPALRTKTSS